MTKNQEKIQEALSRIDQGLASIETDEDWLKFLRFQAQFYRYSFGNQMLIYLQCPEATFVKGFKAWNKLGRFVKRGEKGIMILAPCISKIETFKEPENQAEYHDEKAEKEVRNVIKGFRAAYVYDLCQTDGNFLLLLRDTLLLLWGLSSRSVCGLCSSCIDVFLVRLLKALLRLMGS